MPIAIEVAPQRLRSEHLLIFTKKALEFLEEFVSEFDGKLEKLLLKRERQKLDILDGSWQPEFHNETRHLNWTIGELPKRLKNRVCDLGDISPANTQNFVDALYANVQGVQVRFHLFFLEDPQLCDPDRIDFRWILMMVIVRHGVIQFRDCTMLWQLFIQPFPGFHLT